MIKRFDREFDERTNLYKKHGFYSALTITEQDEYERQNWSYINLVEKMRKLPLNPNDFEELFRRMVFNVACRNTDDHPRNHGFLLNKGNKLKLSPAYDIVPNMAQYGVSTEFYQAMTIGEMGRIGNIKNILSKASSFGLSKYKATDICNQIGEIIVKWRDFLSFYEVDKNQIKLFEASFSEGKKMASLKFKDVKPKI